MKIPLLYSVVYFAVSGWAQNNNNNNNNSTIIGEDIIGERDELEPSVLIAVLVRNKAHTLPYFLTLLERLDYPEDRISIWIRSDHNEDSSPAILKAWASDVESRREYHSVSVETIDSPPYRQPDQTVSAVQWTSKRFRHVIRLKEAALQIARKIWADYIWFLDADAFIVDPQTLRRLISKKKDIVAPMLSSGGLYSNFWGGMQNYYYVRTDDYKEILDRKKSGCFTVPMVHSCYLMNLRKKVVATFERVNETIPEDDIILFATNAKSKNLTMEVCNDHQYGFILAPLDDKQDLRQDYAQMMNLRVEIASYWPTSMEIMPKLSRWAPEDPKMTTLGFDKIYVINLKRRPDRLLKMKNALAILGFEYQLVEATDGR
ncbi:unnamed protein product [Allacma fusca]|nr:unnamed protein product [Allacma fusca]